MTPEILSQVKAEAEDLFKKYSCSHKEAWNLKDDNKVVTEKSFHNAFDEYFEAMHEQMRVLAKERDAHVKSLSKYQSQLEEKEKEVERLKDDNKKLYVQRDALLTQKGEQKLEIEHLTEQLSEARARIAELGKLIPDGFSVWCDNHGWVHHSSREYYYKRGCEWPPRQDEMAEYADLLQQFKSEHNL